MTYDEITTVLNGVGIDLTRSTLANRSRTIDGMFLKPEHDALLVEALRTPDGLSADMVNMLRASHKFAGELLGRIDAGDLGLGLIGEADDVTTTEDIDTSDLDLDTDDFELAGLDEEDDGYDLELGEEGVFGLGDKDEFNLDEDGIDDSSTEDIIDDPDSDDDINLDDDEFDIDELVSGKKSEKKAAKGKKIPSDPDDPWADMGDLRDVTEASPKGGDEFDLDDGLDLEDVFDSE